MREAEGAGEGIPAVDHLPVGNCEEQDASTLCF